MSDRFQFRDNYSTWTVETSNNPGEPPLKMLRVGQGIENMDRDFDQAFWQALGSGAISRAACELVELYLTSKGRAHDLRLQRSVGGLKRVRRTVSRRGRVRRKEASGRPEDKRDLRRLRKDSR
jgi:hypothetical protein